MLKLYPNDKDIIESREINLNIYKKNEIRIKEIKEKIKTFQKNLKEENMNKNIEIKEDNKIKENNSNNKDNNIKNEKDILQELEL